MRNEIHVCSSRKIRQSEHRTGENLRSNRLATSQERFKMERQKTTETLAKDVNILTHVIYPIFNPVETKSSLASYAPSNNHVEEISPFQCMSLYVRSRRHAQYVLFLPSLQTESILLRKERCKSNYYS